MTKYSVWVGVDADMARSTGSYSALKQAACQAVIDEMKGLVENPTFITSFGADRGMGFTFKFDTFEDAEQVPSLVSLAQEIFDKWAPGQFVITGDPKLEYSDATVK